MDVTRRIFIKNATNLLSLVPFSALNYHTKTMAFLEEKTSKDHDFFDTLRKEIDSPEELLIYAFSYKIDKKLHIKKKLKIFCYKIEILDEIMTNGNDVFIFAYEILVSPKVKIITSGKSFDSPEDQLPNATSASAYGTNGNDGASSQSNKGGKGGSLEIWSQKINGKLSIVSNGGKGQAGQNGGAGFVGSPGSRGANTSNRGIGGSPGGRGGNGGNGGRGADGGSGGDSGNVVINIYNGTAPEIDIENEPGIGGQGGLGGQPALGGEGGEGGTIFRTTGQGGNATNGGGELEVTVVGNKPRGASGTAGTMGSNGSSGSTGIRGAATINNASPRAAIKCVNTGMLLCDILDIKIDTLYIESSYEELNHVLSWFENLCGGDIGDVDAKWGYLLAKVRCYAHQSSIGLDFWGHASTYISLLNVNFLKTDLDKFFKTSAEFEEFYFQFLNESADKESRAKNANAAVLQVKTNLLEKSKEKLQALSDCNELNSEIASLSNSINSQYQQLLKTEEAFRRAVEDSTGCSLTNVIQFVNTAVSIGRVVSGDVTAIVSAANGVNEVFTRSYRQEFVPNIITKVKIISSNVEQIDGKLDDLKKQYNELRGMLDPKHDLYAIPEGDFKTLLDKYGQLKEAQALKTDFENYVQTTNNRNHRRIELTQKLIQYNILSCEISTMEVDLSEKNITAFLDEKKIDSAETSILMDKLYFKTRLNALYLLYLERKAFNYWALNSARIENPVNRKLQIIQGEHNNILADIIRKMDERGQGSSKANFDEAFIMEKEKNPNEFDRFFMLDEQGNNILVFNITPHNAKFNLQSWSEIYVTAVRVYFNDVNSVDGMLRIQIVHSGNPLFINRQGQQVNFTHTRVGASMTFSLVENRFVIEQMANSIIGNDRSSNVAYIGYSPFATWKLKLINKGTVDLSRLTKITVGFDFRFLPKLN